jgi:hypothetical protein
VWWHEGPAVAVRQGDPHGPGAQAAGDLTLSIGLDEAGKLEVVHGSDPPGPAIASADLSMSRL